MSADARETIEGMEGARATLAQRLAKHTNGRRWIPSILPLLSEYSSRRACRLNECGRVLMARDAGAAGCAMSAYYCQQWKLCRICAARRSSKSLSILLPKVQARLAEDVTSRAYLVTLTVKGNPGEDCAERFNHLMDSVRKYMRTRVEYQKGNGSQTEPCKASGIYSATETTRGEAGDIWHWHCHMIWICPANVRPSARWLSIEWEEITRDSYRVDCRELWASRDRPIGGAADPVKLTKDLAEVCKYALAPQGMEPADCLEIQKATAGRHFTRTYGALRFTAEETAALEADQPEQEFAEAPARVFRWTVDHARGAYGYVELVRDALAAIDHHPRLLGCREVNRQEEARKRAESFGLGSACGSLDTGAKLGRCHADEDGPARRKPPRDGPGRAGRLRSRPIESEDCFT
jgi:hypothetical protein